jgi:hypothetical protein
LSAGVHKSSRWRHVVRTRSMIKRGAAFYAVVHVCAVRSRRADRDRRALRTVSSRCLSVGVPAHGAALGAHG